MSGATCPHCGKPLPALRRVLTARERSELAYLRDNPGLWGGPLERGEEHQDPIFREWVRDGLIEARKGGIAGTKYGYYLTDFGREALRFVPSGAVR